MQPTLVALAATVLAVGAACAAADDGRALRPPSADQTTTTVATSLPPTTPGVDAGSVSGEAEGQFFPTEPLVLTSPVIVEDGDVPADNTCWGADRSPPLSWSTPPDGTVELAVIVRDISADDFVHWVIAGIDPGTGGLAEGTPPAGSIEALNDFGRPGWAGPCPTDGKHEYDFQVIALDRPSGVTAGQAGAEAVAAIEGEPTYFSGGLRAWASPDPAGG